MAKLDALIERLILGLVARVSGRTVAVIAIVLYGGVGLALPLSLNWSMSWLVGANLIGTSLAGTLILAWLGVQVQARERRREVRIWDGRLDRLRTTLQAEEMEHVLTWGLFGPLGEEDPR